WCWGDNFRGQLGLGDTTDRSLPTQVGTDSDWIMVTAGSGHTCAVKTFRKIRYCWGDNYAGRLGLGTNGATDLEHRMYLSPTSAGDSGWESLSAGSDATCGIRTQHLVAP